MLRLLPLLLAAPLAGACVEDTDAVIVFDERFEDPALAAWTGAAPVERVTTIHPGEHGLRFLGAGAITAPLAVTIYDELQDGQWVEYATDCPAPPAIGVRLLDGGGWEVIVELPTAGQPAAFERVFANLPPLPPRATLTALTLEVRDFRGACTIDNLRVAYSAPEYNW